MEDIQNNDNNDFQINDEETLGLKELITHWIELDNGIKNYRTEIRTLNKTKKEYEGIILDFMESINQDEFGVTRGKVKKNITKTTESVKPDLIKNTLKLLEFSEEDSDKISQLIMDSRKVTEKVQLKQIIPRKTPQKKQQKKK